MHCSWHYSCRTYFCCFLLALANIRPWPLVSFSQTSLKNSDFKTTHNTFRGLSRPLFPTTFLEIAASEMIIMTTKRNKQHGSKSTNHNLQTWPFESAEECRFFLRGPLECVTEAKSVNVNYNFDLRSHFISKRGNVSKEIAGRWQNTSLCQTNIVSWVSYVKFRIHKTLSFETFWFLEKRLLSLFTFCVLCFE